MKVHFCIELNLCIIKKLKDLEVILRNSIKVTLLKISFYIVLDFNINYIKLYYIIYTMSQFNLKNWRHITI